MQFVPKCEASTSNIILPIESGATIVFIFLPRDTNSGCDLTTESVEPSTSGVPLIIDICVGPSDLKAIL